MTGIKTTTLDNGLRIVTDTVEGMHTTALGIWVGVGTRHEHLPENGVAHMVEHMLFKGTKQRNALQIVEELETVGASVNAYTSRELTSYHVHLLKEDAGLGLEVLSDMYLHSVLPDEEIERERDVIIQEIGMNNDTPDDLIFDQYFETAFPAQAMGAPVLGREANITDMKRDMMARHIARFYTPAHSVVTAAGAVNHAQFVEQVQARLGQMPRAKAEPEQKALYQGGECRTEKTLEQAHIVLGFEGLHRFDPDYYAVQVLSTLLGGGMSSRLFQEIREKRGLVYSIFSFHAGYQDTGQFGVYAGTGPDKLGEIMPVICEELMKVTHAVEEIEIARAKAQMKASTLMGLESMMTRADTLAKHMIFRDQAYDIASQIAAIDAVSAPDLLRCARRIFQTAQTLAALGPVKKLESLGKIKEWMAA